LEEWSELLSGYFDTVRYYTGIRLGVIKDKQEMPPLEAGIDFKITDNLL
jgi:hypothetical protein